jgi:capsid protein
LVDTAIEGLAYLRNIRTGIMSLSEALRERGYDPRAVLAEIAADNTLLDKLGIILDSDPRMTTQAGNPRDLGQKEQPAEPDPPDETGKPKPPKPPTDDEEEEE